MELQDYINRIPETHNWASYLMFVGIFQAFWLCYFLFLKTRQTNPLRWLAYALICQTLVCLDSWFCYTGWMKHFLSFNDSTEFLVLCIPPLWFLLVKQLLEPESAHWKNTAPHLVLPLLYLLSQIGYFITPLEVKYNAYISAYHQELPFATVPQEVNYGYHWVKDQLRHLILLSVIFYAVRLYLLVKKHPRTGKNRHDKYRFSRNTLVLMCLLLGLFFSVYLTNEDDGGDHWLILFQAVCFFMITALVFSESRFFQTGWLLEKYDSIRASNAVEFSQIEAIAKNPEFFQNPKLDLPTFSQHLGVNANYISQRINSETGLNFNRYINRHRVREAAKRLHDPRYKLYTIEAVGQSVGFHSKSSFYTSFKLEWSCSPAIYRKKKQQTTANSSSE